jgi:RNA polymerase sigma-70 factor, ECF subfamily
MDTDQPLLNAARQMDKEALVKIFDLYSVALYRYALRLCGDPLRADHIVGDVFAKLLEQFAAGKGPRDNLRSYLYESTYHRLIDDARSARRWISLEIMPGLRAESNPMFPDWEDRILFKQVLNILQNELTDDQRDVIILRFLEEFSIHETAAIMGKQENHVRVLQNRAIAALRRSLETHEQPKMSKAASAARIRKISKAFGF